MSVKPRLLIIAPDLRAGEDYALRDLELPSRSSFEVITRARSHRLMGWRDQAYRVAPHQSPRSWPGLWEELAHLEARGCLRRAVDEDIAIVRAAWANVMVLADSEAIGDRPAFVQELRQTARPDELGSP